MRVAAVRSMFTAIPFSAVIETGTFRALTTLFLRELTDAPIATIEINRGYFEYAGRRLRDKPSVYPFLGHSPDVLAHIAADAAWTSGPAFFYLDAHWHDDLPLVEELKRIKPAWQDFVALVDDFKVDPDDGYAYDDYGPGKSLELGLLSDPKFADLRVFWPAAPATAESGVRQGYVVLATPGAMADALSSLSELREAGTLGAALASR